MRRSEHLLAVQHDIEALAFLLGAEPQADGAIGTGLAKRASPAPRSSQARPQRCTGWCDISA
nr:hypothetical protein [uncultured Rhodopila sp.]